MAEQATPKMFRKVAIDRLSSPERLDEMMHITSRRTWFSLVGLITLLVVSLVWGIVGTIPTTVSGKGVVIREGGTFPIPALVSGQVIAVIVTVGEQVVKGQVIATIMPLAGGAQFDVKSLYLGRVLEIGVDVGNLVQPTTSIVTIEHTDKPLEAVIYLPSHLGKQIQVGMKAEIEPVTVSKQNFGYMIGTVSSVAPFPSSQQGMARLLGNDALVQTLFRASGGSPLEVHVTLVEDQSTVSHFKWSSGGGPNIEITSGTLIANEIIIFEQRPLSLVLPVLR